MSLRSEYYIRHECKLYFLIINWHNNRHNILDKVVLIKCIKLSTWRPLWTIYTKMHLMTWRYKMSRFWLLFAKQRQKLQVAKHQQLDKKKKKIPFTQQNVQFPTSFTCEEHHNPVFQLLKTVNCLPGFTNRPHHDICVCKLEFAYLKLRICPRSFRMNCGSFQPISPLQTWSCLENQRINQINCDLLH